jgi:phosphodiesterase/alkaline phosphatase D-like protein
LEQPPALNPEERMQTLRQVFAFVLLTALAALPSMAQRPEDERITAGPRIEQVTNTGATIAWTTNTGGSSVIRYGTDPNHLDRTAESPYADREHRDYQTHRVELKNLRPNTTYYYRVISGQGEGTGTSDRSRVEEFRTR